MRWYLFILFFSSLASFILTWVVLKVSLKYKLYPKVRERDVHKQPTPRLGGVAMFLAMVLTLAVSSQIEFLDQIFTDSTMIWGIIFAALIIVVVGVLDDLFDLHWLIKLVVQFGAAFVLAFNGVRLFSLSLGFVEIDSDPLLIGITVFAVVLTMNAVNFIDGLDGLVAGVAIIANGVFFVYSYILLINTPYTSVFNLASLTSAILVGVCIGFLAWNRHPARIFMGDSGALLVGLLMATSAITVTGQINYEGLGQSQWLPAFIPILLPFAILILPFMDFVLAVTRRLLAGRSPFSADRGHIHHKLLEMGHGHQKTVYLFYAWTATFAIGFLLLFVLQTFFGSYYPAIPVIIVGILLCSWWTFQPLLSKLKTRTKKAKVDGSS